MRYSKKVLSPLFMIISALSFAMMSATVKQAGDIPFIQKVLFRNLIILLIILPVISFRARRAGSFRLFTGTLGTRKLLLARSLTGLVGVLLYFFSVERLTLGDSAIINKLSAFFAILLSSLFLRERIKKFHIPALIAAFSGALLIIRPGFNMQALPAAAGLVAAVAAAVAYTLIAGLRGREDSMTLILWFSSISVLVTLIPVIMTWTTPNSTELTALILTGIFAALGQYFLTLAYSYGQVSEVSIFNYTQVVFSLLIGIVLWQELPDSVSLLGAALIIGAAVFLYIKQRGSS